MKRIYVYILCCCLSTVTYALELSDIDEGDNVCVDGFFNSKAVVITKDYSDSTVKIRLKSTGEYVWKKPDELIGETYCVLENEGQKVIIESIIDSLQK